MSKDELFDLYVEIQGGNTDALTALYDVYGRNFNEVSITTRDAHRMYVHLNRLDVIV